MNTNYLYDYIVNRIVYDDYITMVEMIDLYHLLGYYFNYTNRQQCPFYMVKYCDYDVNIYEV